uniref:Uncharacterized protein n=2 Tax=Aegilops tauschii subsp. strangulata TaxID=200361 RepID=A0A453IGF5_AEGTS
MIRAWRWIAAYICYPHYHFLDHSMDGLLQIHVVVAGSCRPSLVLASHQDRLRLVHADAAVAPCGAPLMLHLLPCGLLWLPPLHPGYAGGGGHGAATAKGTAALFTLIVGFTCLA